MGVFRAGGKISGLESRTYKIIQDAPKGGATALRINARHLCAFLVGARFNATLTATWHKISIRRF